VPGARRIVVVRHGETKWSASGRHTSDTDLSLTEEGRRRAHALAPALHSGEFVLVVCSPLKRARETCDLAGFGAVANVCADLHEWQYGEYEGMTTPQIRERVPEWSLWRDGCPGGERPDQVGARADGLLAKFDRVDGDVLAFAHGHILRVLAARWLEWPVAGGARLALSAGAIGILGYERDTRVLRRWNAVPAGLL
jgi:probable phosphoglycerate mutase